MIYSRNKHPAPAAGFTLIELLVVIGIISVLMAFLFPVLFRMRQEAQRTNVASNMRQMVAGFVAYATDNEDALPGYPDVPDGSSSAAIWERGQRSPNRFFSSYPGDPLSTIDLRTIAARYGFIKATNHPFLETPAWDDKGNTAISQASPYAWMPANGMPFITSPRRLSRGKSTDTMIQEDTEVDPTLSVWYCSWAPGSLAYSFPDNSSSGWHLTDKRERMRGTWVATYDGAVRWVPEAGLTLYPFTNGWYFLKLAP